MADTNSGADAQDRIAATIRSHPVVLFMKGTPAFPLCGFSAAVSAVLQHYGVTPHTIDVLRDPAVREGIKRYSDWPTMPQLYVDGSFIGGCDIVREMHEAGELEPLLAPHRAVAAS